MKPAAPLSVALALSCVGPQQYRRVDQYLGRDLKMYVQVEEENERPEQVVQLSDGNQAYTWVHHFTWIKCRVTLVADRERVVKAYRVDGCGEFDRADGDVAKLKELDDKVAEAALTPERSGEHE